jgi:hypothetical protein
VTMMTTVMVMTKSEYISIWKDAVMACLEVLFCCLPEETEKTQVFQWNVRTCSMHGRVLYNSCWKTWWEENTEHT